MTSRKFFILFFICAAIPLVAAQLSLSMGWFQQGSINKGQWLQHEIQLLPDASALSQSAPLQDMSSQGRLLQNTSPTSTSLPKPSLTSSSLNNSLIKTKVDPNVHWHLVYVQADSCDQLCEHALFTLQQLYAGMGRKQIKIKPIVMAQQQPEQLKKFPAIGWLLEPPVASELQNQIVIVNQRGLVLLRYPIVDSPEQMRDLAKDIRTDLLRLINYDRSGA